LGPLIGVSCAWSLETWSSDESQDGYLYVGKEYVDAVLDSGGIPFVLPIVSNEETLKAVVMDIVSVLDGLLLSGGGSVEGIPSKPTRPTLIEQQPIRYQFEKELLLRTREREIPIFGICRGCQMIAEVFGGKMNYSCFLQGHRQKEPGDRPTHSIKIIDGTEARQVLQVDAMMVNSFHVQSIDVLPQGFVASGISDDGVIEMIESTVDPFVWGTQFHPEEMRLSSDLAKKIIDFFIEKAQAYKESRS